MTPPVPRVIDAAAIESWSRKVVAAQVKAARPPSRLDRYRRWSGMLREFYRREARRRGAWGALRLLVARGRRRVLPAVWRRTGGRAVAVVRRVTGRA